VTAEFVVFKVVTPCHYLLGGIDLSGSGTVIFKNHNAFIYDFVNYFKNFKAIIHQYAYQPIITFSLYVSGIVGIRDWRIFASGNNILCNSNLHAD